MKRRILLAMAMTLALSTMLAGCGKKEPVKEDDVTSVEEAEEDIKESAEAVDLTQDELDVFTDLFDTDEYNGFLKYSYSSPEKIDWESVFFDGAGVEKEDVSKSEKNAYLKEIESDFLEGDLVAINAADAKKFVEGHTDLEFDGEKMFPNWTYLEKYDCYYSQHGDTEYEPYTCISGKKLGDEYVLDFQNDYSAEYEYWLYPDTEITIRKVEDGYKILSNTTLWEKNNDPQQTFDLDVSWSDTPYRVVTYQGNPDEDEAARMLVLKDGKQLDYLLTYIYPQYDDTITIYTVAAIGAFDFTGDGLTDVVVVGDCDDGQRHMVLYEGLGKEEEYNVFSMLTENSLWLEGFVSGELNIPNIKAYLLGGNTTGTYSSWQDAYAQVAKIKNDSDVTFSLIYLDDDDVPELVEDKDFYSVNVYSFKDGVAKPLMKNWYYGSVDVDGYYYAPKKGLVEYTDGYEMQEYFGTFNKETMTIDKPEIDSKEYNKLHDMAREQTLEPISGSMEYTDFLTEIGVF